MTLNSATRPAQSNPIAQLQNWSAAKKTGQPPADLKYQDVIETFQQDMSYLQSLDTNGAVSGTYEDKDARPGEVNVPNLALLESVDDGFKASRAVGGGYYGGGGLTGYHDAGGQRNYHINSGTGTITVENWDRGGTGGWSYNAVPATIERYTLDTNDGTIADYSKKGWDAKA